MLWVTLHWSLFLSATNQSRFVAVGNLTAGGTYVVLVTQNTGDITIIVESMRYNESLCIRSNPTFYTVADVQNVSFQLNDTSAGTNFTLWRSCLSWQYGQGDYAPSYFQSQDHVVVDAKGYLSLTVEANCIYTLSTRKGIQRPIFSTPKDATPFPLPYADNFENGAIGGGAKYFGDQMGKFERVAGGRDGSGFALMQVVIEYVPISNNCPTHWYPFTAIGDMFFKDLSLRVDVALGTEMDGRPIGVYIAMRTREWNSADATGAFREKVPGIFFWLNSTGWRLCADNSCLTVLCDNLLDTQNAGVWHTMQLDLFGRLAWGWLDGTSVFAAQPLPAWNSTIGPINDNGIPFPYGFVPDSGWTGLGSTYSSAKFDNLEIKGLHRQGRMAVPIASLAAVQAGAWVLSVPCSLSIVTWALTTDFRVVLARDDQLLCLVSGNQRDPLLNATSVELGSCTAATVLFYDVTTGRISTTASTLNTFIKIVEEQIDNVPLCLDVRGATDTYEARTVMLPCASLPYASQQFQFSGAVKTTNGIFRTGKGSCLTRSYSMSPNDDWDNYRDCCIGF